MAAKHRYRRVQLRKRHTDIANTESELNDMGWRMPVSVMSVICRRCYPRFGVFPHIWLGDRACLEGVQSGDRA